MAKTRIQKALSEAGVASRRAVEQMVLEGRISVNGRVVGALPCFVDLETDRLCADGQVVRWRFPHGGCGHPADAYLRPRGEDIEIGTCSCGARYVTDDPRWTCRVCGAVSVVPPREPGELGFLHDHIHGEREVTQISIRAFIP